MDLHNMQIMAGSISSLIFASSTLDMLIKAWRTGDMRSYSLTSLTLANIGNAIHWLYILSLPAGPIYALHSFYTVSTVLMLAWAVAYRRRENRKPVSRQRTYDSQTSLALTHLSTQEMRGV